MGNISQTHIGSSKAYHSLPFVEENFTNTAAGTLNAANGTAEDYYMSRGGSIIGFSGALNAALTTGTLSFQPMIDGSLCPVFGSDSYIHSGQQRGYVTQDARKDNYTFTAGQRLAVKWVKVGSDAISATTVDGAFQLEVLLEDVLY
jgi:hypothetical protein